MAKDRIPVPLPLWSPTSPEFRLPRKGAAEAESRPSISLHVELAVVVDHPRRKNSRSVRGNRKPPSLEESGQHPPFPTSFSRPSSLPSNKLRARSRVHVLREHTFSSPAADHRVHPGKRRLSASLEEIRGKRRRSAASTVSHVSSPSVNKYGASHVFVCAEAHVFRLNQSPNVYDRCATPERLCEQS